MTVDCHHFAQKFRPTRIFVLDEVKNCSHIADYRDGKHAERGMKMDQIKATVKFLNENFDPKNIKRISEDREIEMEMELDDSFLSGFIDA